MADPTVDLILSTGDHDSVDTMAERARLAESLGFDHVTMGETTDWNVVPVLAAIAERTDEIGIADDVVSPYSRAPTVLGQAALTLHDVTDGRFRLGLGTSSPALAEGWHGRAFDRPLRRLRETIDVVREVYAGGRVGYDGEIFEVDGLEYGGPTPDDPPPIDVAALGPTAVELAGRFGDGWIPQLLTADGLAERMDDLRRGADLGGRDAEDLRVTPIVRCCASEDRETARELTRAHVAFMLGAYGPYYGDSLAREGYEGVVEALRGHWADRDTEAMADALPVDLFDALAAAGTPGEVRERVAAFTAIDGVDAVRVGVPADVSEATKDDTLRAIAG